jgi:hypothetical protein
MLQRPQTAELKGVTKYFILQTEIISVTPYSATCTALIVYLGLRWGRGEVDGLS